MDILKDDPAEFLDFAGVEDSEKSRILSLLHSTTSNLPLPWIITQNVPSLQPTNKQFGDSKKSIPLTPNQLNMNVGVSQNQSVPPSAFVPHHQGQFQPLYPITTNITTKFPVSPGLYTPPYPTAVVPMAPIYTNFHHAPPQGLMTDTAPLMNPVIYSPEPLYTLPQVSPVPATFDNIQQFAQNPQPGSNMPTSVTSHHKHNGVIPEGIPTTVNNIPQPVYPRNAIAIIDPATGVSIPVTPYVNVDTDQGNSNTKKVMLLDKSVHPGPTVSYGVPNSSPFPANKEASPALSPSLGVNKTEYEKSNSSVLENGQGEVTTNGHNGVENTSLGNKSWASLFNKGPSTGVSNIGKSNSPVQEVKDNENNNLSRPNVNPNEDPFLDYTHYRLRNYFLNHTVDEKTISLQPRGLINRSNYCYINSILQALLACPPLYNLLSDLSKLITSNDNKKPTPVVESMCKLVNEFEHLPAGQRVGRRSDKNQKKEAGVSINCGNPFEPAWIYKMLNGMRSDSFLIEGRQEDAEEFFGCLLNGLNDEIIELMKITTNNKESTIESTPQIDQESEDWQVMGPKNKGSITRRTFFTGTPIGSIFGGLLSSKIHRAGDKSTNNIQPFFTLQLNIEKVKTVSEALEALTIKNQLEGVTSSKTNEQVEAWQQVMIQKLPVVLVLHLKCFDYQLNGCTKITKALEFPIDLKIDPKLICTKINSSKENQYKLFAVVYHDGKEASKGHYLTDAFHVGYNSWLRYDDASVKPVSEEHVLSPQGCRVPYLLFYRRRSK